MTSNYPKSPKQIHPSAITQAQSSERNQQLQSQTDAREGMTLKCLAVGFHALRSHGLLGLFWASRGKTYRKGHCRRISKTSSQAATMP